MIRMRRSFFTFLVLVAYMVQAQTTPTTKRTCGTEVPDQAWNEAFNKNVEEFRKNNSGEKVQSANYTIPVIFHVIHGGQASGTFPNMSQAQISSQIKVLNDDYAGTGFNVGNFASTNFNPSLIANCNITFCLAEKDPSGASLVEKGIERVSYTARGWFNPTTYTTAADFKNFIDVTVKSNTIWDPRRYLNIWVTDVNSNVGLLGYATFPPVSGLSGVPSGMGTLVDDGIWCWSRALGDVGTLTSSYNKGRTITHEVGHYLGLRHIWGDSGCGTDYCSDTPPQQAENTTCPTYPHVTCSNGPNGDMFMNFMDYCYDACLYMFSNDQRARMQTAMANSPLRTQLSASSATLCNGSSGDCFLTLNNFSNLDTLSAYRRVTAGAGDTQCPQGSGRAGYLTGTNCYDDKEKAEFIHYSKYFSVTNPVVTGVIVLFFQYGNLGTDGTGNVGMNIYFGTSVNAAPGLLLGSTVENLSTISSSTNTTGVTYCGDPSLAFSLPVIMPYKFDFTSPVSVPQYGGFFASVVLPTGAGDTVVIMDKRTGSSNTAWEKLDDNRWVDMKSSWGGSQNFNLAIIPIVECAPVGIKKNSQFYNSMNLFPNPSTGKVSLITSLPSSQKLNVNVYTPMGQKVFSQVINEAKQNLIDIDLSDQATGIYFVEINNGEEVIVKKLVLTK